MSDNVIRKLLETRTSAIAGGIAADSTAFENVGFTPRNGTPYQRLKLLPAKTPNPTMGDGFRRGLGLFQVTLHFPPKAGAWPAGEAAQLIMDAFKRGTTMTEGSVRVLVDQAPYVAPGVEGGDWYMLAVTVPYVADIQG